MQMTQLKKTLSLILCIVLIAATALLAVGCSDDTTPTQATVSESTLAPEEGNVLGEGATQFTFTVTDLEGNETSWQINTDKKMVGEALLDLGLIAGDQGEYGLYVKTVNGLTLDYDTDGKYWAFYVDGVYGTVGVDSTEIVPGAVYAFKAE